MATAVGQDELELVRKLYERWGRGDLAAIVEFSDPDIEFASTGSETAGLAGEWSGPREMWAAITQLPPHGGDTNAYPSPEMAKRAIALLPRELGVATY